MSDTEILDLALRLKPNEEKTVDDDLDEIWGNEAERRLKAYREGKLDSISMDLVFGSEM